MKVSTDELHNAATSRCDLTSALAVFARCFFAFVLTCIGSANAQPRGTLPPSELIGESVGQPDGLQVRGFMFLDSSGNPVLMPRMTFERLRELESGSNDDQSTFVYKSLDIEGTVDEGRAELTVQIRFAVDATGDGLVSVPLKMGNFHLLRAPEFSSSPPATPGRDVERMTISSDGGYVVWVRADKPREIVVNMTVSARADQASRESLYFRLPNVPAKIRVKVPQANAVGEINGRGDEVLQRALIRSTTEFRIESGGGSFQLHWGGEQRATDNGARFEVESSASCSWSVPETRPTVSIQYRIRGLRDRVGDFELLMPEGAELIGKPTLTESGRSMTVNRDGDRRLAVSVPDDERAESIDLSLSCLLANPDPAGWLDFAIPGVVGTLSHEGDAVIVTSGDYRLRWRASQGITRTLTDSFDDAPNTRTYAFQFDRGEFAMPIMVSAQQQKLRLSCQSVVKISNGTADLEMTIRSSGEASDSRQFDLDFAGWNELLVVDADSGDDLVISTSGTTAQVSLTQDVGAQASLIRVTAIRDVEQEGSRVRFELPRIDAADESLLIEKNDVTIRNTGRSALVVDLSESKAVEASNASDTGSVNAMISEIRIQPPRAQAVIAGSMVPQPPQLTLESAANISLEDAQVVTSVNWLVTSPSNLQGRLDIAITPIESELAPLARGPMSLENSTEVMNEPGNWTVTVNGRAALLSPIGPGRYELKSGLLGAGTFAIQWRQSKSISGAETQGISLPRLRDADVEVRGDILVELSGNQDAELYAADSPSRANLAFSEPPSEPIRFRLVRRATGEREQSVPQVVLRSAVGLKTRHEQILALTRGGDSFRVAVSSDVNLNAEAYVDGERVTLQRTDDELVVQLPGDQSTYVVDIRVWVEEPSSGTFATIKPLIELPVGVGRVYWQIVLPEDSHVVWVAPTIGQAMHWELSDWRLYRKPVFDDQALCERVGVATAAPMPPSGNRYLYIGSDFPSFEARIATRATIWMLVGGAVLLFASLLAYFPVLRSPLTVVFVAVVFAGLLAVAPDSAVLFGQFAVVALLLVAVMLAVRVIVVPRSRAMAPPEVALPEGSTRAVAEVQVRPGSSIRSTENLVTKEPSEISP